MTETLLNFVQISDIHLRAGLAPTNWWLSADPAALLRRAVEAVQRLPGVEFVLFTGDLLDRAEEAALDQFFEIVADLPCPYYVVAGNHDVAVEPGPGQLGKRALARRLGLPGRLFYSCALKNGYRLIALDSIPETAPRMQGVLSAEQQAWLGEELRIHREEVTIVALHHPPIVAAPGWDWRFRPADSLQLSEALAAAPNVAVLVNGHLHFPRFWRTGRRAHLSAPALGGPPNAIRPIQILREAGQVYLRYDWLPVRPEGQTPLWYPLVTGGNCDRSGRIALPLPALQFQDAPAGIPRL
ncbi:metallophosphoesterase [Gloeobacter kilaueensis]|uniref:Metallophosphoesterase n=1 Tax=Gloeobacter kilaueensis (strain ATCC BAA-2537 / CCAP 1431/1 / ULC 316 / JS1) TaxID=1183438 RepID=U5QI80_GLOK1|nr:metallophosphoesterase [Gloeobacter kilaueensis]AGY57345.1 metallophosphoesterase [Gloeobacter kilaueensis JS1]